MLLLVLYPCVPATNRWRVQGATLPSPQDSLDLLQNLLRSHVQGKQWQMIEGGEAANVNPECFVSFQPSFPDWAKATPKHDSSISSWSVLPRIFTPPRRNLIKSIIYPQRPPRGVTKMLLNDKGVLSTFFFLKIGGNLLAPEEPAGSDSQFHMPAAGPCPCLLHSSFPPQFILLAWHFHSCRRPLFSHSSR